jgi:hypothetical protein
MVGRGVAVEKLAHSEFAKIGSRQEALQTIFLNLLDIFYRPIFDFFQKTEFFNSHRISQHLSAPERRFEKLVPQISALEASERD